MRFNSATKFREGRLELHRRRGAPNGNRNRLKHGRYSATVIAQRKLVRQTIRSARVALMAAKAELEFDRLTLVRDTPARRAYDEQM